MIKIIVLCDILLVLMDCITVFSLRDFLIDFLIGVRNRKNAKKIHAQQTLKRRITLSYIKPLLKRHITAFTVHHLIYMIVITTLIPQYMIVFVCNFIYGIDSRYIIYFVVGIKGLVNLIVRLQCDSNRISMYR